MKLIRNLGLGLAFSIIALASSAMAGEKATVQKFYDLLSNPGSQEQVAEFKEAVGENWESIGNYSGKNKTRAAFLGQMEGFAKLIPDLDWEVQAMHQEGNAVVVRSRATGTPKGPMFGVDGQGRSFDILTIDIHHLEDGKIVKTYHVEDWAGALQQLAGK
ncbi:MAG: ester cyclase [Pseudomonadota bacterium]